MGCDIHCYIEYRKKNIDSKNEIDKGWTSFGGRINPGRNYGMFRLMAGVRSYDDSILFKPKGLPDDIGYHADDDNFLYISTNKNCGCGDCPHVSIDSASDWVRKGISVYKNNINGEPTWVSNPDWHSHSWLNLEEYRQVLEAYKTVEQRNWKTREKERLESIEYLKSISDVNLPPDSWVMSPCEHFEEPEYHVIEAAMTKFEEMGYDSRLVFWFDN